MNAEEQKPFWECISNSVNLTKTDLTVPVGNEVKFNQEPNKQVIPGFIKVTSEDDTSTIININSIVVILNKIDLNSTNGVKSIILVNSTTKYDSDCIWHATETTEEIENKIIEAKRALQHNN